MRLHCPHCQRTLEVPDSAAGKQVRCPACSKTTRAPESTPGEQPPPSDSVDTARARKSLYSQPPATSPLSPPMPVEPPTEREAPKEREPSKERIERTACPKCAKMLLVTPTLANQIVACPACHSRIRMPSVADAGRGVPATLAFGSGTGVEVRETRTLPSISEGPRSPEGTAPASWTSADWKQPTGQLAAPTSAGPSRPYARPGADPMSDPYSASSQTAAKDPYTTPVGADNSGWRPPPATGRSEPILYILPGTFQLTFAALTLLITLIAIAGSVTDLVGVGPANNSDAVATLIFQIASLITASVIIVGSVQMIRRRSLGLARAAAILAILPCNVCCIALIPFGIWSTVMLFLPNAPNDFS